MEPLFIAKDACRVLYNSDHFRIDGRLSRLKHLVTVGDFGPSMA